MTEMEQQPQPIRIQKWISQLGIASRREAERWIQAGRISINGQVISDLGHRVDPLLDRIFVDGKPIAKPEAPRVYWLLNKPDMVLTSRGSQQAGSASIYDLPRLSKLNFVVSPVGRLDYRTEGLLLLSNDSDFIQRMSQPEMRMPRHYLALINGKLKDSNLKDIQSGITLDDGPVRGVRIQYAHGKNLGRSRGSWYFVTVHEGRNRLIRRIFDHFEMPVVKLVRYGLGSLRMPEDLKPGEYIQLSPAQIAKLRHDAILEQ